MAYEDLNTRFVSNTNTYTDNTSMNTLQYADEDKIVLKGIESIKAGIRRFLNTPKGHDPFDREYGCCLYNLLFENDIALSDIQMLLYMDITTFEPRINISPMGISLQKLDNNTYTVFCNFTIPEFNNASAGIGATINRE